MRRLSASLASRFRSSLPQPSASSRATTSSSSSSSSSSSVDDLLEPVEGDAELDAALDSIDPSDDPLEIALDPSTPPALPPLEDILATPEPGKSKSSRRDHKEYTPPPTMQFKPAPELDSLGRAYATGKRKASVARVWLWEGDQGRLSINNRYLDAHFPLVERRKEVLFPLVVCNLLGKVDLMCTVRGGGTSGQSAALSHGIAKALERFDPPLREPLKREKLLTRDARTVERKKPGKSKARRSPQFSKR